MAFGVNTEDLTDKSESTPETKFIPAGVQPARLVSYVELGKHKPMFKGKIARVEKGKNAGREKPACLHIMLTFEFPTCEYTGDFPLTISTTRQLSNGDFMNAVTVPPFLMEPHPPRGLAMKTSFMKYLTRMQEATSKSYPTLAQFAQEKTAVMINVTNKTKDDKVFANMKPEGITSCVIQDPITKVITDYTDQIPAAIGEYCPSFEWDAPTAESWSALKPWDKKIIKSAVDFPGSPIDELLSANPELDAIEDGDDVKDETPNTPAEPMKPSMPAKGDIPV